MRLAWTRPTRGLRRDSRTRQFRGGGRSVACDAVAISQRIKALEKAGRPRCCWCAESLCGNAGRHTAAQAGRPDRDVGAESIAEMAGGGEAAPRPRSRWLVNADSMATWFVRVLSELPDVLFDIRIEDQDHSARWLRGGCCHGCGHHRAHPGTRCRVHPLGVMRYLPVASADYVKRYFPAVSRQKRWRRAPSLAWNRDDALQNMLVRRHSVVLLSARSHTCPPPKASAPRYTPSLGGGCIPSSRRHRRSRTARSSRSAVSTSTSRCSAVLEARQPSDGVADRDRAGRRRRTAAGLTERSQSLRNGLPMC